MDGKCDFDPPVIIFHDFERFDTIATCRRARTPGSEVDG